VYGIIIDKISYNVIPRLIDNPTPGDIASVVNKYKLIKLINDRDDLKRNFVKSIL
jgi:hypothetical protein